MSMRAVLLAAGLGTRLRPLTDRLPKCLAPIKGRPLLGYWLRMLSAGGVKPTLINTHHHAPLVEYYIRNGEWRHDIVIAHEPELLGTGGTVLANREFVGYGPVLIAHADNLTVFDIDTFIRSHALRPKGTSMTMMTFTTPAPSTCGIVTTDAQGVLTGFFEKVANPPGNHANAAVYILEGEVVEFMCGLGKHFMDISTEVLPHFVGKSSTWHNTTYHRDIGTLQSWRQAQLDFPEVDAPLPDAAWEGVLNLMGGDSRQFITDLLAE